MQPFEPLDLRVIRDLDAADHHRLDRLNLIAPRRAGRNPLTRYPPQQIGLLARFVANFPNVDDRHDKQDDHRQPDHKLNKLRHASTVTFRAATFAARARSRFNRAAAAFTADLTRPPRRPNAAA